MTRVQPSQERPDTESSGRRDSLANGYHISINSPSGYTHAGAFEELIFSLRQGFKALGFDVSVSTNQYSKTKTNIIFGSNFLAEKDRRGIPESSIFYNLGPRCSPSM